MNPMERSSLLVNPDLEHRTVSSNQDIPSAEVVSPVSALEPNQVDSESESEFPQRSVEAPHRSIEPTTIPTDPQPGEDAQGRVLKSYKVGLVIAIFYVGLTSTEWVLVCFLTLTPLVPRSDYKNYLVATRALASLSALLALPTASAVLARTSVTLTRSNTHRPNLTLRQALAYVDRAWTDLIVLFRLVTTKSSRKQFSIFLGVSYLLCVIVLSIPLLHGIFVSYETIEVPSFSLLNSDPSMHIAEGTISNSTAHLGREYLSTIHHASTTTGTFDPQPMIWGVADLGTGQTLLQALESPYWLSVQVNTTNTGFSDLTSWRMNSSVLCEVSDYPQNCLGAQPWQFTTTLNQSDAQFLKMLEETGIWSIESTACMPGNTAQYPWNYTSARQDFQEDIYVKINRTTIGDRKAELNSYRCTGRTTNGYFYLPNYHHQVETRPLSYENSKYLLSSPTGQQAQSTNTSNYNIYDLPYHTPLRASVLVFFSDLSSLLDPSGYPLPQLSTSIPLTTFTSQYHKNKNFSSVPNQTPYWTYLQQFSDKPYLESALRFGMFLANKHYMLAQSSLASNSTWTRPIDMGVSTTIVSIPIPAIAVISFLLLLQAIGLLGMGIWSSKQLVWTEVFDARAMFVLAQEVGRSKRAVGTGDLPGWVGDKRPEEAVGRLTLGGRAELIAVRRYAGLDREGWEREGESGSQGPLELGGREPVL